MKTSTLLLILSLLAAGAAVHGAVTQRWSTFAPDAIKSERAHALVVAFADCESSPIENDVPPKERSVATSRRYVSAANGFGATTSIISGVPGAVATHTPDVCYTSSGYTMIRAPQRQTLALPNGRTATILAADFEKPKATATERVRVRWAWSVDGAWSVPDYARFQFLKHPELFKLYVVTTLPVDGDEDSPTAAAFAAACFQQYGEALAR